MTRLDKIERLNQRAAAKTAKRSRKKEDLADNAIMALKQLGYARTSLRDIAELSGVAVGTLHYYFEDKTDLIGFCVRRYKAGFVAEMDAILQDGDGAAPLPDRFARGLAMSIRRDAETHRLWYDIRSQALFDPAFEEVVDGIETALVALVERLLVQIGAPREGALDAYLRIDAAFRYFLQRHLAGAKDAPAAFEAHVAPMFDG